jgi:hypothetical protein
MPGDPVIHQNGQEPVFPGSFSGARNECNPGMYWRSVDCIHSTGESPVLEKIQLMVVSSSELQTIITSSTAAKLYKVDYRCK